VRERPQLLEGRRRSCQLGLSCTRAASKDVQYFLVVVVVVVVVVPGGAGADLGA
jgi:hypothetical protein